MPSLTLNDLIESDGLDPRTTLIMRHTPHGRFRRAVPFIVHSAPELFAVYESAQVNASVIASFRKCRTGLSFLGYEDGRTIFMTAFAIGEEATLTRHDYEQDHHWRQLHKDFGLDSENKRNYDQHVSRFAHAPIDTWRPFSGRLQIEWSGGSRSWCRRAHTNTFTIAAITAESEFSAAMPSPHALTLRAPELAVLPPSWQAELSRWRGIYLITVEGEGARYVGAAYGEHNMLGRWRAHVAGEMGVTKELSLRNSETFRFSILELLAPDATMDEVIACERCWMDRLHTIEYGLNV